MFNRHTLPHAVSHPTHHLKSYLLSTVGGHTGSIYAEDVTPETKRYTPTKINQVLENYDNVLNNITKKRDAAILAGDAVEVERLNTKGMKYASLTKGFNVVI